MGLVNDYQTPSQFFKVIDMTGPQMIVTIKDVSETTFKDNATGTEKVQPVISFEEHEKALGLNKTNREKLAELFGAPDEASGILDVQPQDLIGQKICLYKSTTQMQNGSTVPCVRIRAVPTTRNAQRQPANANPGPRQAPPKGRAAVVQNTQRRQPAAAPVDDENSPFNGPDEGDAIEADR